MELKYTQGEIYLVNFHFPTDESVSKVRPALLISNDFCHKEGIDDFIFLPITSNIRATKFSYYLESSKVERSLQVDSEVRANKIATISKDKVIKRISAVTKDALKEILEMVCYSIKQD